MEHRDYLKKQVDQLAKVLAKILGNLVGLKSAAELGERIESSKQQLKDELDLDVEHLFSTSESEFLSCLQEYSSEALENLAHILLVMADHSGSEMRPEQKTDLYKKILAIYDFLQKNQVNYSYGRHLTIERIKKSIDSI